MEPFFPSKKDKKKIAIKRYSDFIGLIARSTFCLVIYFTLSRKAMEAKSASSLAMNSIAFLFFILSLVLFVFIQSEIEDYANHLVNSISNNVLKIFLKVFSFIFSALIFFSIYNGILMFIDGQAQ